MYESPAEALRKYEAAGMRIGKVQVSSALRVDLTGPDRQKAIDALHVYDESTYLHQVVQRSHDGRLVSFRDLNDALATAPDAGACEWRVHFHVPLFWDGPGPLRSTREAILETFGVLRERPFTQHLEVETYTWDVLPPDLKVSSRTRSSGNCAGCNVSSEVLPGWPRRLRGYLALARISNSPTIVSNVLAGAALGAMTAGTTAEPGTLLALMAAMVAYYTAGMYLNDYLDFQIDCRERPERPCHRASCPEARHLPSPWAFSAWARCCCGRLVSSRSWVECC
ncbi:hypothetical protein ACFSC4_26390 [Deinococcus malanensis]|uniref:hypothetical protein n=1 Tax=Deinococcus malanensis TaxID=1706855 RepID=UPI00362EF330